MDGLDPSTQSARVRAREKVYWPREGAARWVAGSEAGHGELGVILRNPKPR